MRNDIARATRESPPTNEVKNKRRKIADDIEKMLKEEDVSCEDARSIIGTVAEEMRALEDASIRHTSYKDIFP